MTPCPSLLCLTAMLVFRHVPSPLQLHSLQLLRSPNGTFSNLPAPCFRRFLSSLLCLRATLGFCHTPSRHAMSSHLCNWSATQCSCYAVLKPKSSLFEPACSMLREILEQNSFSLVHCPHPLQLLPPTLQQLLRRQYLHFCTSKAGKLSTCDVVHLASFCTSEVGNLTFVPVKQVN
jgi:hypothetical protein